MYLAFTHIFFQILFLTAWLHASVTVCDLQTVSVTKTVKSSETGACCLMGGDRKSSPMTIMTVLKPRTANARPLDVRAALVSSVQNNSMSKTGSDRTGLLNSSSLLTPSATSSSASRVSLTSSIRSPTASSCASSLTHATLPETTPFVSVGSSRNNLTLIAVASASNETSKSIADCEFLSKTANVSNHLHCTSIAATSATYYCESGAVSTHIPSKYGTGNWSTSRCSVALTGNTGYSNLQMWTESDAIGAWEYVANLPYDGSIDWTSFIARELNFSSWQEYQCQELSTNNNCMYQEDCSSPITPGAWMVVNSIANLWGYHWDLYNTIQTAHTQIDVDLVVNNFSPQFDEAAYLQHEIFLTGLTFGIMMGIGALFSFGAEFAVAAADLAATAAEAAEVASTEAGLIADGVAPEEAATQAAQIAKSDTRKKYEHAGKIATILLAHDTLAGVAMFEIMSARYADGNAEDGLAAQNVLTDLISNYTNQWQTSEAAFISQLFNGSQSSVKNVGDAIVNGTWLTPWNETSSHDNFTSTSLPLIEKHLYGLMVPYAWAAATKSKNQIMPVVIMADGCLRNITQLLPKDDVGEPQMRFDKGVDNSKICFEGKTFWLLTPYKTGHDDMSRFESGIEYSDRVRFQNPPGLTMLSGASNVYGGLKIEDIIISSYYGWGNNTFMNPTTKPDPASILKQEAWIQSVQYPGFFNYAICNGLPGILAAAQSFWDKSYTSPC